ncbi:MAG TPA: SpvB/TcaC N-terminal domain-containing protein [Myxococcales bacterium]|nr:SpvB/TcaC N-terminal domain-containing protein [Myxococcales bacterium]
MDPRTDVSALFDRDTTTALQLTAPTTLTLTFAHEVEVRSLKVFGAQALSIRLGSAPTQTLDGPGRWVQAAQVPAGKLSQWTVTLAPTAGSTALTELELWGAGLGSAPRDGNALAVASAGGAGLPFDNAFVVASSLDSAALDPAGPVGSMPCASFDFISALPLQAVRRAYFAYEAAGVQRSVVLRRSLNGAAAVGGMWLGGGTLDRSIADEIDPRKLTGADSVQLCLPDDATQTVLVGSPRLVLEMDDGTNLLDRDGQARFTAAFDGRLDTVGQLAPDALPLSLERTFALDYAGIDMVGGPLKVLIYAADGPGKSNPLKATLQQGWNSFVVPSTGVSWVGVEVDPLGPPIDTAAVVEAAAVGSPVGRNGRAARIVVTYPALRWASGHFVGERFGENAFVTGWAESPAGPGALTIGGAPVGLNGAISSALTRPAAMAGTTASWPVTLTARFPDGTVATRDIYLDDDHSADLLAENGDPSATAGDDVRFGAEDVDSSDLVDPQKGGKVKLGSDVAVDAPAGAVGALTSLTITRHGSELVPRLGPGMVNVTAPRGAGYRFTPHGQQFSTAVAITLPYDDKLLPQGKTPEHVLTWFYDEESAKWQPLARRSLIRGRRQIVSETTHFTFMINAVIVDPSHPGPTSYNPTSIKDIKVAEPSAGIDFIEAPLANSQGTANVALPIRIPSARGAYTPALALTYNSQGQSGWTGIGWDLSVSTISIDTTFGAPFYDGSDRYMVEGRQLVPVGTGSCQDGSIGKRFAARAEGAFDFILRCGPDPASFHFERADRSGTLFVYGASPEARVASPRTGAVGVWHLERVIDTNGNLCHYVYEQDQKRSPGTAFDAATGEDFRQSYLTEIHYTGKAARLGPSAVSSGSDAETGAYAVIFQRRHEGAGIADRPDIVTSARTGFKIVTRHLLERVQVWLLAGPAEQRGIVREYVLRYELGDFGKSRIASVDVFGRGGDNGSAPFNTHRFSYTSVTPGFGSPVAWSFDGSDDRALTSTAEFSVGVHAYTGISLGPLRDEGSVGFSVSTNHRESTTEAIMIDLNGDGIPDRVTRDGRVQFGQSRTDATGAVIRRISAVAPPGDPLNGGTLGTSFIPTLGSETGNNFNFGLQTVFGPVFANVGGSFNFSSSDSFLIDADGDGLPDVVTGGQVLFNFPRTCTGPGCSPADRFLFGTTKPLSGPTTFANLGDTAAVNAALDAARQALRDQTPPNDAMLEWTAPFQGTVNLSGEIAWARTPPTGPGRDGVRLRLYQAHEEGIMDFPGQPIFEARRLPTDVDPTPISIPNLSVLPQDHIYFVLSTLDDFPVGSDTTQSPPRPVPLEEITFSPTFQYTSCTGDCGALTADDAPLVDPTGAPLFTFNTAADFKLAGSPLTSVQPAFSGTLHVSGDVDKQATTADDVRVCAQRFPFGTRPTDVFCGSPFDVSSTTIASDFVGLTPFKADFQVQAGDSLVFRIDTELPIDPAAIVWSPIGVMTTVCDSSGVCRTPLPSELASTSFIADPYFRLHSRFEPIPLRPLVVPHDGTLSVSSTAASLSGNVAFSVRTQGRLWLKHHAGEDANVSFPVTAGEQVFFEAHAETDPGFREWPVLVTLDGEPFIVPLHVTFEQPRTPVMASPFGGGFHGWRYGTWSGTAADVFDSSLFYRPVDDVTFAGTNDRERGLDAKRQFRDPNNPVSQRGRLFSTMIPRRRGTQNVTTPGLAPTPAFVSQDGTAFVTRDTMHAGRRGGLASSSGQQGSTQGLFAVGDVSRASSGQTISGGIGINLGITNLSVSVSAGSNTQTLDARDMNGDGIIDVVSDGSGARLTHLNTLTPRASTGGPFSLQKTSDLSVSAGLGFSEPFRDASAQGNMRGLYAMFPSSIGGGIAANLSEVKTELIDINGDGLPDQVRLDRSTGRLMVRLNLGTSFAAAEDALPGATWSTTAGFDPFSERVQGQVGGLTPADDDESGGQGGALGVLEGLTSPNVVRRSNSATLELNAGFVFEEEFGATVNFESTLNATSVEFIDVTGDGLPDFVRKGSGDNFFRVRVNTGFGFGPEQIWPVADWPVQKPQLRLPFSALQTVVNDLGFGGGADSIEASATNTAIPSVGFAASVTIPLSPALTPWLIISVGGDVSPRKLTGFELNLTDIDGDGIPDHVLKIDGGNSASQSAVFARLNQNAGANLLTHVDEPLGGSFDITWVRAGNTVAMPENRFVMSSVTLHDGFGSGAGHDLTSLMRYDGGLHDRNEREFFGFATVQTVRPDGSFLVHRYHNDSSRRANLLAVEELHDATGALFGATFNLFDDSPAQVAPALDECRAITPFFLSGDDYCSAAWIRLLRTEQRFYEGTTSDLAQAPITTAQDFSYDLTTGNVIAADDFGDVADPAEGYSATVEYLTGPAADTLHAIDRPRHIAVRAGAVGASGPILRERLAEYDGLGNPVRTRLSLGNGVAVSDFVRDGDGNLKTYIGPSNARGERYATDYVYDPTTRSFVVQATDVFGYSSTADYDLGLAELIRTNDLNGNSTFRVFDKFGRLCQVFGPYDPPPSGRPSQNCTDGQPTISVSYTPAVRPAFALTAQKLPQPKRDGSTTLDTVVFMDGFRRVVQSRADAEVQGNLGTTVSGRLGFDAKGRVMSRGQATFSQAPKTTFVLTPARNPTTYLYDVLDRMLLVAAPDGSNTITAFGFGTTAGDPVLRFRTAVIDAEQRLHATFVDGRDRTSTVEERIEGRVPTVHYVYDPLGQLTASIDAAGNATTMAYDLGGRTTAVATPDSGLTEFAYDPAGNMISKVDPNLRAAGRAVSYVYQFNRLTRIVRPISGDITFEYGPPGAPENAASRVTRIVDEAGSETRGYGRLGELVRTKRTLIALTPGDRSRSFETRSILDSFGRLLQLVYPDGETVSYGYDGGGLLSSAVSQRPATQHTPPETEVYLASLRYDEFGARVALQPGNGVVTNFGYDPLTRRLSSLQTVTPQGRVLQALTYAYDRVGNLRSEVNARPPSTNKSSGPVSYNFQYDALDRLVEATGVADARPNLVDRFSASYRYSDIHNLTRNVQVHQLLHGPPGNAQQPKDTNHDFTYLYQGAGPHQATQIGDQHLVYDLNGNTAFQCRTLSGTCAGSTDVTGGPVSHQQLRQYLWGENNELRASFDQGTNDPVRFLYDAAGQRVAKFQNGIGTRDISIGQFFTILGQHHMTKHVFAGGIRIASKLMPDNDEVDFLKAAEAGTAAVCGGASLPACQTKATGPKGQFAAETYYFHPDHLGSTSWITDHAGSIHEHVEYFPYGEVWRDFNVDLDPGPPPKAPPFLFTGKELDPETGLTYFGARYYDSRLARWISNDPALLKAESHTPPLLSGYLYGQGHPIRHVDPDGRGLLDIAFVAVDIYEFYKEPSLLNGAFLAYDALSLVIQTPSAGTVRVAAKGIEIANAVRREAEIASTAKKIAETTHVIEGTEKAAQGVHAAEGATHAAEAEAQAVKVEEKTGRIRDPETGRFQKDPNRPKSPYEYTDSQRRADWKKLAEDPKSSLTDAQRKEIKERGWRGPQRENPVTREKETMELSHEPVPLREGGTNVVPRWPADHARVDPHRQLKKPSLD